MQVFFSPLFLRLGCKLTKHSTIPFNKSFSQTTSPFQLIHSDIWGPARIPSRLGYLYYVSFIDDFTRFTSVYLMRQQSEIPSIYQTFTAMIHTQFNAKIKTFRADCAREYISTTMRSILQSHDSLFQQSCPYTHEQNGVALFCNHLLFLAFFGQRLFLPLITLLKSLNHLSWLARHLMSVSTLLLLTIACSAHLGVHVMSSFL